MREPYDNEIAVLRQMIEQSIGRNVTTPADAASCIWVRGTSR